MKLAPIPDAVAEGSGRRLLQIPFAIPDIGDREIAAVTECLRSGWITTGKRCQQFERSFAEFLGGGIEAVAVSSCTEGLQIALAALGIGHGDEVITTDMTFSATAMSIVHVGARPVLVDIDPATLNIDIQKIEQAITPRTKAIMPVHYAGLACDMSAISALATRHGLKIVEDAAHAFPTVSNGQTIGRKTSDATVFSFYATKTITTGEGGMITTADSTLAQRMRVLRLHGIDQDIFNRHTSKVAPWRYEIVAPGYKSNLTDMAAALGIVQLQRAWEMHERRARLWNNYNEQLVGLPLDTPPRPSIGDVHAYHLYPIRLRSDAPIGRDAFIEKMRAQGINCGVHFIPLHLHRYWKETLGISAKDFPQAQHAFERLVSLPLYSAMKPEIQQYIVDEIRSILA